MKKSLALWSLLLIVWSINTIELTAQLSHLTTITEAGAKNPNEVSVAINPINSDHIVAVSMQFVHPDGTSGISNYSYVSEDGGKTWSTHANPNPERRRQGDDAVTFFAHGLAVRSYISFDGIRVARPEIARNGIFVTTSSDGKNWSRPTVVVDHINTVLPFEDKPWLIADKQTDSPHLGNVYVSWTRFDEYASSLPGDSTQIWFAVSSDSGKTFKPPFRISDHGGNTLDDDFTVEGAIPAVDRQGNIFVAWSGPRGIELDRSFDGGKNFGKDKIVVEHVGGWDLPVGDFDRHNGMPVTGIDVSKGAKSGRLYINWMDTRNGNPDVFLIHSDDQGETWSPVIQVNAVENKPTNQLFTWMSIDPIDGSVNIVYFDQTLMQDEKIGLTLSRSVDGGRTFTHFSIPVEAFVLPKRAFFGDYIGIDALGGKVVAVFTLSNPSEELSIQSAIFDFRLGSVDPR